MEASRFSNVRSTDGPCQQLTPVPFTRRQESIVRSTRWGPCRQLLLTPPGSTLKLNGDKALVALDSDASDSISKEECQDRQDQEHEEEDLRDSNKRSGDSAKSQEGCNQGNNETRDG